MANFRLPFETPAHLSKTRAAALLDWAAGQSDCRHQHHHPPLVPPSRRTGCNRNSNIRLHTPQMASFTALNGGSPKAASPVNGSVEVKAPPPEDRSKAESKTGAPVPAAEAPSSQREGWPERPQYTSRYSDVEGSHKRKRSDSLEPMREHPPPPQPERAEEPTSATLLTPSHGESRDPYGTPQREYRQGPYGHGNESARDQSSDQWYSQQRRDDRSAQHSQQRSEEIAGDAMRRSNPADADYPATSPDGDDRSIHAYDGQYSGDPRQDKLLQGDLKKRKRVFANRTKTGCLTCRRRKKKCDEQKPECEFGSPPKSIVGWRHCAYILSQATIAFEGDLSAPDINRRRGLGPSRIRRLGL